MRPKIVREKKVLGCSCGYIDRGNEKVTFTEKPTGQSAGVEVVEKEQMAYPIIDAQCPKCKHDKAYSWTQQMRAGDEPETHFVRCVKCGHTWREGK
jgi:DNA-directed RNA polymerase subunit M